MGRCIITFMRYLLAFAMLLPLCAQDAPKKGPQPPKNLKILKPEEVRPAMASFVAGLGLGNNCNYCHVQGDRASDDNPKKNVARMMIAMVKEINAKFPDGAEKAKVTCYTCHRGKEMPETAPPAAQ
jgi:photosynthetic reaction center cytochrome c subunit